MPSIPEKALEARTLNAVRGHFLRASGWRERLDKEQALIRVAGMSDSELQMMRGVGKKSLSWIRAHQINIPAMRSDEV
jgi:hypothetical protein